MTNLNLIAFYWIKWTLKRQKLLHMPHVFLILNFNYTGGKKSKRKLKTDELVNQWWTLVGQAIIQSCCEVTSLESVHSTASSCHSATPRHHRRGDDHPERKMHPADFTAKQKFWPNPDGRLCHVTWLVSCVSALCNNSSWMIFNLLCRTASWRGESPS